MAQGPRGSRSFFHGCPSSDGLDEKSRVTRDCYARFCGGLGVRFPGATRCSWVAKWSCWIHCCRVACGRFGCYEMLMWLVRTSSKPTTLEAKEKVDIDQLAVRAYRESARIGSPLSERKLADKYGKSRCWARSIIEMSGNQEGGGS